MAHIQIHRSISSSTRRSASQQPPALGPSPRPAAPGAHGLCAALRLALAPEEWGGGGQTAPRLLPGGWAGWGGRGGWLWGEEGEGATGATGAGWGESPWGGVRPAEYENFPGSWKSMRGNSALGIWSCGVALESCGARSGLIRSMWESCWQVSPVVAFQMR